MKILFKIILLTIFSRPLTGCVHGALPPQPLQEKEISKLTTDLTALHDGSKGGDYGIGVGWSVKLLPAEYETVVETFTLSHPPYSNLISIPAEYEWRKDDSIDQTGETIILSELITAPAEYMTVTETVVIEPERTEYYLTEASFNSDGSIKTPRTVKSEVIPAVTKQQEQQVVKTPERFVERKVSIEGRKGYRYVVKTPARTLEKPWLGKSYSTQRRVETQPWRFLIKTPDNLTLHVFDDFDNFNTFLEHLKNKV